MHHGLYHCSFPDAVVILDPLTDRYRLLKGEGAARFNRAVHEIASKADQDWLAGLQIDPASCKLPNSIATPTVSAVEAVARSSNMFATVHAVWLQRRYQKRLFSQPLLTILTALEARRPILPKADEQRLKEIVSGFRNAKHWISAQDQCLPRALAMIHKLFSSGLDAQLVFGVTMPFAAHCWVQHGETVLSDPLDRVLPFRPIMVL